MKVIGITCVYGEEERVARLSFDYIDAVEKAEGLPFPVGVLDKDLLPHLLEKLDGLLLTGGGDMDPCYYNEEPLSGHREISPLRDEVEFHLVKLALQRGKPLLAICRGMQVLNIAAGGSIYQDTGQAKDLYLEHMQKAPRTHPFHEVNIFPGTLLWEVLGEREQLRVNSFHHQVVKELAPGFRTCAVSNDGATEALESGSGSFALGVQWHPEALARAGCPGGQELFDAFLQAVKKGNPR